ncbi:MAG: transglycosylase SLT domain-containing protein [Caldimonas sp.]
MKWGAPSESTGLRGVADGCRAAIVLFATGCAALPAAATSLQSDESPEARIAALRVDAVAYEHGNGQLRDGLRAAALYCQAAKLGDAASQFDLGWMYANGRGVQRDDALAAYFFQTAAAQGLPQAIAMLKRVGEPGAEVPECMRDPVVVMEAAPTPVMEEPPELPITAPRPILDLVTKLAPQYQVSPRLVLAVIAAESNFNQLAVSPKNAQGLMQLIPETAQRFGVKNAFDPVQNVRGGIAYLRWLLAYFEGDVALVAAAYNAGERAVERHLGVPPFLETRAYVRRILAAVRPMTQFDASVVEPSPRLRLIRERQSAK